MGNNAMNSADLLITTCIHCGNPISTFRRNPTNIHPECRRERKTQQERERRLEREAVGGKAYNYTWSVMEDPDPLGGFHRGAKFSDTEVAMMLAYESFTVGTKLNHIRMRIQFTVTDHHTLKNGTKVGHVQNGKLVIRELG